MKKEKWDNLKRADDANVAEQTAESYREIALRESPWKENILDYTALSLELGKLYAAIGLDRLWLRQRIVVRGGRFVCFYLKRYGWRHLL